MSVRPRPTADLRRDFSRPEAYLAPGPGRVEIRTTHISLVFLTEADVYKVKRPVSLGFLDFSTPEARLRACEAEVALNERLAAGVYLGVVPVRLGRDGRACFHGDGEVIDWAVHMLRLPDAARADVLLSEGRLSPEDVDRVARHLAAFHARCETSDAIAAYGAPAAICANVVENFAETRATIARYVLAEEASEIERRQLAFLDRNADLLERRRAGGMVRDGHGDLRLEHVYLDDDGITILDAIEFADRFRYADVACDLAFLSMDLAANGRVDLAERLLAHYARASDDFDLYAVADFYESYRAHVRAKVASILAETAETEALRARADADARRHYLLALACERRGLLAPVVVCVGGVIASGKSTVADALADRLAAPVVDADRTRKALLGVAHEAKVHVGAFEGPYDPRVTDEVYDEMTRRAARVLASGRPVVLDASFRTAALRQKARALAAAHHAPFLFVECTAPERVCLERLERREEEQSVSDGRRAIFRDFVARVEPPTELPAREHLAVDTTRPLADTIARVEERVCTWPRGLVA